MTDRRLALLGCPLLAILLYLPTLGHDFVFDDLGVIGQNPLLRDIRDLPRAIAAPYWNAPQSSRNLYRPLTTATFAVDRALAGGMHPLWFHLVNVLLHGLATLLVTRLAFAVLPGVGGPALAGALFAAHPVHVEAVAGVVGRSEILAACGVLIAVLAHRRALRSPAGARAARWALGSWLAALAGMLAKESAATAVALCGLTDLAFPTSPPPPRGRRLRLYAGLGAALGIYLVARLLVLGSLGVGARIPLVDNPAASAGAIDGRLTALAVLPRYAALLIWPAHLSADYSFDQIPVAHSVLDLWVVGGLLLVLLTIAGGAALQRTAPACGYALLWLAMSASLTTNLIVFIGTLLAERLMYLPSVGLCLIAGCLFARVRRPGAARAAALLAVVACAAASGRTWARLPDWKDDFSLYRSAAQVSPRSARIRYNLGNAYMRKLEYAAAEENFRAALVIYPDYNEARLNLGMTFLQQSRPREALDLLKAAAARDPRDADLAVDLGSAYRALGDQASAEIEFRRALELDPLSAKAWNDLGSMALARGDARGAVADLTEAIRCEPGFAVFRVNLADALTGAGRTADAVAQFEEAYRLDPDLPEAHRGLGEVALQRGDAATAERQFRIAAHGAPPSARAANFLGYLLAQRGDLRGAAEQYERALHIDPRLFDAHRSLGLLYAQRLGEPGKAAYHLEASLELNPVQPGAGDLRRLLRSLRR